MKFSLYALIVLTQTAKVVFSFAADAGDYGGISKDADYNFTSIAGNYGSVESVDINLSCPTNKNIQLPSLMFTIIPGELASVSSFPSNVVYTVVKDGVLSFTGYNLDAAGKSIGGVKITLPADSLKKVTIDGSNTAQVLDGFTSLEHIQANAGTLTVTATTSSTSEVHLDADGQSTVNLVSNVNLVTSTGITGQSTVQVKTPSFKDVIVGKQAELSIDGGIDGGTVQGQSTVTVTGDISGTVSAGGQSTINAGDISGTVRAGEQSTINTPTCGNVVKTGQASCDDEIVAPSVSVDTTKQSLVADSVISCSPSFGSSSTPDDSSGSSPTVAIVTASLVAVAVVAQAM